MASRVSYLAVLALWVAALWAGLDFAARKRAPPTAVPTTQIDWPDFFAANVLPSLPVADEFDTPLRPPDGNGAFITLPFLFRGNGPGPMHLGEDWATAKGDATLGEPVYSVADGWVSVAQESGPFDKVVFVCYRLPENRWPPFVEMMYAELNTIDVHAGQFVTRGQKIGTVGNVQGTYPAHLHWELRQTVGLGLGPGWDTKRDGWLGPSDFIVAHRGLRFKQPLRTTIVGDKDRDGWGTDY